MDKKKITIGQVLASKHELRGIGIDYNITGLTGEITNKYPTGYYEIKITHEWKGIKFINNFYIPEHLIEILS